MTKEVKEKLLAETPSKPVKIKVEKPAKLSANGALRPYAHTKCGAIWEVADQLSALHQRPATKQEVLDRCAELGYNLGNAKDEHARWRRFNGLTRSAKQAEAGVPALALANLAP